jgi:hypothetical protein
MSSVGDACFFSTPVVWSTTVYESWLVVAQPEKIQMLAATKAIIKNARVFFMRVMRPNKKS